MGCDGGTIPRRDELVRTKKKPEQKDKDSELLFRWRHCAITQQLLQSPIVACGLGRLYNKDTVLETLLDKSALPEAAQHIKSIKDVRDLNLTDNPAYKPTLAEKGDVYVDRQAAPYICPVIGIEMNGKFKFCFLWKCGCVLSERALKEIKTTICHKCQQAFSEEDVVVLNAAEDELGLMRTRLEARQAKSKAERKAKNEAKRKHKNIESAEGKATDEEIRNAPSTSKQIRLAEPGTQEVKPDPSAKLTKGNGAVNGSRLEKHGSKSIGIQDPAFSKTKLSYSVSKDPKASEVFKSLFTSHKNAIGQEKAHWITYNPFYN